MTVEGSYNQFNITSETTFRPEYILRAPLIVNEAAKNLSEVAEVRRGDKMIILDSERSKPEFETEEKPGDVIELGKLGFRERLLLSVQDKYQGACKWLGEDPKRFVATAITSVGGTFVCWDNFLKIVNGDITLPNLALGVGLLAGTYFSASTGINTLKYRWDSFRNPEPESKEVAKTRKKGLNPIKKLAAIAAFSVAATGALGENPRGAVLNIDHSDNPSTIMLPTRENNYTLSIAGTDVYSGMHFKFSRADLENVTRYEMDILASSLRVNTGYDHANVNDQSVFEILKFNFGIDRPETLIAAMVLQESRGQNINPLQLTLGRWGHPTSAEFSAMTSDQRWDASLMALMDCLLYHPDNLWMAVQAFNGTYYKADRTTIDTARIPYANIVRGIYENRRALELIPAA